MGNSSRRSREELKSIEKQLPLFYQKIENLERRQNEIKSHLAEAADKDRGKTRSSPKTSPDTSSTTASAPRQTGEFSEIAKIADLFQKDRLVGILGEANDQLKTLNEVVNRAVNTIQSIMLIIDLLENHGQEIQMLLEAAKLNTSGNGEPKPGGQKSGAINPDMISELMKSPQFSQLVTQVMVNMKPPEQAPKESADQVPTQGALWGPRGGPGPW